MWDFSSSDNNQIRCPLRTRPPPPQFSGCSCCWFRLQVQLSVRLSPKSQRAVKGTHTNTSTEGVVPLAVLTHTASAVVQGQHTDSPTSSLASSWTGPRLAAQPGPLSLVSWHPHIQGTSKHCQGRKLTSQPYQNLQPGQALAPSSCWCPPTCTLVQPHAYQRILLVNFARTQASLRHLVPRYKSKPTAGPPSDPTAPVTHSLFSSCRC